MTNMLAQSEQVSNGNFMPLIKINIQRHVSINLFSYFCKAINPIKE